mmetsp:Transcript_30331/g.66695  ORF Transcript_30331/g.66695 Transcript_30331/m.66695 type:complete len:122 (+) Transcript_30331:159-524(+)
MKRKSPTMEISEGEDAGPSEASPGAELAAGGEGGGAADNPEWAGGGRGSGGGGGGGGDSSSNPSEAPPAWEGGGRGKGRGGGGGGGSRGFRSKGGGDDVRPPIAAHRNFYDGFIDDFGKDC